MSFKDAANEDLASFLNLDEFGEEIEVNNKTIIAVFDEDLSKRRPKALSDQNPEGLFITEKTLYARIENIERPAEGEVLRVNKRMYLVKEVSEAAGLLEITLEVNES